MPALLKAFLIVMALLGLLGLALIIGGAVSGGEMPRLIPWREVWVTRMICHG